MRVERQRALDENNQRLEAKRNYQSCGASALGELAVEETPEAPGQSSLMARKVTFKKKVTSFTGKNALKDRAEDVKLLIVKSQTKRAKDLDPDEQLCTFSDPSAEPGSAVGLQEEGRVAEHEEVEEQDSQDGYGESKDTIRKQLKGSL